HGFEAIFAVLAPTRQRMAGSIDEDSSAIPAHFAFRTAIGIGLAVMHGKIPNLSERAQSTCQQYAKSPCFSPQSPPLPRGTVNAAPIDLGMAGSFNVYALGNFAAANGS